MSDTINPLFTVYDREKIASFVNIRPGETKLGQLVQTLPEGAPLSDLKNIPGTFVLLGIPEDIGVRANYGVGGAHTIWLPALRAILNTQSADGVKPPIVLGAFDFDDWMAKGLDASVDELREQVGRIDDVVYPVIEAIVGAGKIPIVIGGGHNNAFPLLKGTSAAIKQGVSCINLDAHTDYRQMEGRHSGNGFRYAKNEGYLSKYAIIGLHRMYNSEAILNEMHGSQDLQYSFYEDIFVSETLRFKDAVASAIKHTGGNVTGLELDLDCIEGVLSSAVTPCGISTLQARQYLQLCARSTDVAYLHLTEGATQLRDGRSDAGAGKLIAYLVCDFLSAMAKN